MKLFSKWRRGRPAPAPAVDVALADSMVRGWFNEDSGELFPGFPVGPADVVADIGCGDGGNARFCASRGARLLLADIDEGALTRAAARATAEPACPAVQTYLTDSNPLPIASATASRVVCTEVSEHVAVRALLLSELVRIGQPGALYLLSCPDPASEEIQQHVAHPNYFAPPNHIRILSHAAFAAYAEAAGLTILSQQSDGFYRSIWLALFWATGVPLEKPEHPLLDAWSETWRLLLAQPRGAAIKRALDELRQMRQIILAQKP